MKEFNSIEDLILDESFLNYVYKTNPKDVKYWEGYQEDYSDKQFLIQSASQYLKNLHTAIGQMEAEESYDVLKTTIEYSKSKSIWRLSRYYHVAASILVLFLGSFLVYRLYNQKQAVYNIVNQTKVSERDSVILSDGTKIILNSNSKLLVSDDFGIKDRKIEIEGEVYLDIAKNKDLPFIISTKTFDVRVLGTILNIRSYPNDDIAETSLIEGSAEVILKNSTEKPIRLKPSDKIVTPLVNISEQIIDGELKKDFETKKYVLDKVRSYDLDEKLVETSWVSQKLIFSNETLSSIAKKLERWYDVTIEFGENDVVKNRKYTAAFDDKEKMENILESLKASISFNYYKTKDNTIIINSTN